MLCWNEGVSWDAGESSLRALFRFLVHGLLPLVVVAAGGYGTYVMLLTPPRAEKHDADLPVPTVKVQPLAREEIPIHVEAFGSVIPARQVVLQPEVGGRVLTQHPNLIPGGLIFSGEEILRIDPSEYEIAVRKAKAQLATAQANLDMEAGQQTIARREWELLEEDLTEGLANPSLVLREPQLQSTEAARDLAQTVLDEAELALSRTILKAPFDALVLQESVETGQLVDRQTRIATLVGIEEFWIEAKVPLSDLERIRMPDEQGLGGSKVRVHLLERGGSASIREGTVIRRLGDLDPMGRMARVLVGVKDPLSLESVEGGGALLLESYVRLEIEAGVLEDVYSIPRIAIRENSRIWVCTPENRLEVRDLDVVWRREADHLARNGVKEGDRLIVSRLSYVMPGMEVRVAREASETGSEMQLTGEIPSATEARIRG